MQKELDMIMENFPEYRDKIAELFRNNEDFKSLCMDYWQCRNAVLKLREAVLDDVRTENEYVRLLNELEQETERFLGRCT